MKEGLIYTTTRKYKLIYYSGGIEPCLIELTTCNKMTINESRWYHYP
jgi:hypothetical protein